MRSWIYFIFYFCYICCFFLFNRVCNLVISFLFNFMFFMVYVFCFYMIVLGVNICFFFVLFFIYVKGRLLRCRSIFIIIVLICAYFRCVFFIVLYKVFFIFLIDFSYNLFYYGDFDKLNCYVICCCVKKFCSVLFLRILLI